MTHTQIIAIVDIAGGICETPPLKEMNLGKPAPACRFPKLQASQKKSLEACSAALGHRFNFPLQCTNQGQLFAWYHSGLKTCLESLKGMQPYICRKWAPHFKPPRKSECNPIPPPSPKREGVPLKHGWGSCFPSFPLTSSAPSAIPSPQL